MFRHYHDKVPIVFNDFFIQNDAIHEHNTRTKTNLHQPLWKSEIMKKSIRIKGVYIWNHVNSHIAIDNTLNSFKTSLRKFLIGNVNIYHAFP